MKYMPIPAAGVAIPVSDILGLQARFRVDKIYTPVFPTKSSDALLVEEDIITSVVFDILYLYLDEDEDSKSKLKDALGRKQKVMVVPIDSMEIVFKGDVYDFLSSPLYTESDEKSQDLNAKRVRGLRRFIARKEIQATKTDFTQDATSTATDLPTESLLLEDEQITQDDIEKNNQRANKLAKFFTEKAQAHENIGVDMVEQMFASNPKYYKTNVYDPYVAKLRSWSQEINADD